MSESCRIKKPSTMEELLMIYDGLEQILAFSWLPPDLRTIDNLLLLNHSVHELAFYYLKTEQKTAVNLSKLTSYIEQFNAFPFLIAHDKTHEAIACLDMRAQKLIKYHYSEILNEKPSVRLKSEKCIQKAKMNSQNNHANSNIKDELAL